MFIILRILLFLTFNKKVFTRNPPGLVIPESDHSQQNDYYQSNHKEICGKRRIIVSRQRRIVGGKKSSFGEWPWQVSIIKKPNWEVAPVDFDGFGNDRGDCGGGCGGRQDRGRVEALGLGDVRGEGVKVPEVEHR